MQDGQVTRDGKLAARVTWDKRRVGKSEALPTVSLISGGQDESVPTLDCSSISQALGAR